MKPIAHETVSELLNNLAAATPAPGGGAAAALIGATAAALVEMVSGLSLKKVTTGPDTDLHQATLKSMAEARARLLTLADDDAAAYDAFIQATRLPKGEQHERDVRAQAISVAAERAAEIPLESLRVITAVAESAHRLTGRSLISAASDLEVARRFARAAGLSAAENVEVNLPFIDDPERRSSFASGAAAAIALLERATQA